MSDYREPIVLTLFKPVSDGYVFRAPSPWVVGPARHYLVNEAQKTELNDPRLQGEGFMWSRFEIDYPPPPARPPAR